MSRSKRRKRPDPLAFDTDWEGTHLSRERQKARDLRASQWWKRQRAKGYCHYCDQSVPAGELTMDHIVPLARGGRTTKGNVVPACKSCNTAKRQMLPLEWERWLEEFRNRGKDGGGDASV